MKNKGWNLFFWIVLIIVSGKIILICEKHNKGLVGAIVGALITIFIEQGYKTIQDLSDNTNWKRAQRQLERGNYIKDDTVIRISFAYLFRIKVGSKYLLVQNSRETGKYQPVGGVYHLSCEEKIVLKNRFHVMDDDKIIIDESSRDDYRLRLENKYLRKFLKRFDSKNANRERINDVGREFREELIDSGILGWDKISYRYCGRHITDLKFGEYFQSYELLLADIVELLPTEKQRLELESLIRKKSDKYSFETSGSIRCLGVDVEKGKLYDRIGSHTPKILQENEGQLIKIDGVGEIYTVILK